MTTNTMIFFIARLTFFLPMLMLFSPSIAAPLLELEQRDVYVPPILYPNNAHIVWHCGQTHKVTWDTSSPPKQITNRHGSIYLVKDGLADLDHPLAQGFDILKGHQEVKVPKVSSGQYQILLMGDSGNRGNPFTINC